MWYLTAKNLEMMEEKVPHLATVQTVDLAYASRHDRDYDADATAGGNSAPFNGFFAPPINQR